MTARRELPQRRYAETFEINFGGIGQNYEVTVGYYPDGDNPRGDLGEVFISFGKSGAQAESITHDAAVITSIALQYGAPLETIAGAIKRDSKGYPTSIIGAVIDGVCDLIPRQR